MVVAVIAAVCLISMALAALLYVGISGLTSQPGPPPIGTVFAIRSATPGSCSSTMLTMEECAGQGDFLYQLSVEYAAISLGDVSFLVHTEGGTVFRNTGPAEFALVNGSSGVAAFALIPTGAGLAMPNSWTSYGNGFSSSSSFGVFGASYLAIVVDLGQTAPTTAQNLVFLAVGTGGYIGSVATALP